MTRNPPAAQPLRRYLRLRTKLLGLETYHLYAGSIPRYKTDKTYPYEGSTDLGIASVEPLGAEDVSQSRTCVSRGGSDV